MLVSGSRGAPYTCLRCQLRQAIFQHRRKCIDQTHLNSARSFSATQRRRDQEDDDPIQIPRQRSDLRYVHPVGRIVGAPGRRQRQSSQQLKIDAMKKPFEVIVMQDVREPEEVKLPRRRVQNGVIVNTAELEREMESEGQEPTQDEVNEAISALRPDTTILDEQEFEDLGKSLADGFTTEQLHGFFTQTLNLSAIEGDTVHLLRQQPSELQTRYRQTQWRLGRTHLEKRLPFGTVVRKNEKPNKSKLAEQILRLAWNLSVHAEEQKMGELELKLESWEMKYLFDLRVGKQQSRLMVDKFVASDFLSRACNIRPYRPHQYVRISGRRQDAEEVAKKLTEGLPQIERLSVQVDVFKPLLGTPGWPSSLDKLWTSEDINYVQQRTFSVVEQPEPETLYIYGNTLGHRLEARRLLFGLLELPTPSATTIFQPNAPRKAALLPEVAGSAVPQRHRKLELARLTMPTARVAIVEDEEPGESAAKSNQRKAEISVSPRNIRKRLAEFSTPTLPPLAKSQWDLQKARTVTWMAQLCRILYAEESSSKPSKKSRTAQHGSDNLTVVNAQTHHLAALLSFFKPRETLDEPAARSMASPLLHAHFIPMPFGKLGPQAFRTLPPIELAYRFFTDENGNQDVYLVEAQAILQRQDLRVPLPTEASDLRFERWARMAMSGLKMTKAPEVEQFTQKLRESLRAGKESNLAGKSHVRFFLPASVIHGSAEKLPPGTSDEPYDYMFMAFEQTQKRDFIPMDVSELPRNMIAEDKALLAGFGDRLCLQLRDVAAGTVGGRRTEVNLQHYARVAPGSLARGTANAKTDGQTPADHVVDEEEHDGSAATPRDQSNLLLAKTALGLARMLTKISRGELHERIVHQPLPQREGEGEAAREEGPVNAFDRQAVTPASATV